MNNDVGLEGWVFRILLYVTGIGALVAFVLFVGFMAL